VTLKRQRELGRRHAAGIVAHLDAIDAATRQRHGNVGGAGIDRILDDLFERARRPLDDLTRGDAVNEMFGKSAD
jgi:hypothetical protein